MIVPVAGFAKLVNLELKSFMDAIKMVQHLPSTICEHPHLRDATQLDLSYAKMVVLPEGQCFVLVELETCSSVWCKAFTAFSCFC